MNYKVRDFTDKQRKTIANCVENNIAIPKAIRIKIYKMLYNGIKEHFMFMCNILGTIFPDISKYQYETLLPEFNREKFNKFCLNNGYNNIPPYKFNAIETSWYVHEIYNDKSRQEAVQARKDFVEHIINELC